MKGLSHCIGVFSMNSYIYIKYICTQYFDWCTTCIFKFLLNWWFCFSSDSGIFERNSADRILAVAPVSNKALVVIVFPITIGILQSWWITYFAGAKKNKGFICCHCSLILFKVCSPLLFFSSYFGACMVLVSGCYLHPETSRLSRGGCFFQGRPWFLLDLWSWRRHEDVALKAKVRNWHGHQM